jgi:hypothetical protein
MCLLCSEIGNHFACGGRVVETLWSDLEENFFPDMRMGGPCMSGLSPASEAQARRAPHGLVLRTGRDRRQRLGGLAEASRPAATRRIEPIVREEVVPYYETPEFFWKRELELEAAMRAHEAELAATKEP